MAGEQGMLRPVAGIVTGLALGRARVRCTVFGLGGEGEYTWPVLNGATTLQMGMRVLVFFSDALLSSGVVLGEAPPGVDWRQIGAQWWAGYRASLLGRSAPAPDGTLSWAAVGDPFPLGEEGSPATVGGLLLPDGRVLCVPGSAPTARLFNPADDSFTTSTAAWPWSAPGAYHLRGGVLLPDGRAFLAPMLEPYAYLYDPAADRLTRSAALTPTTAAPLLLPDGTVLLANYRQLYRYAPDSGALSASACIFGNEVWGLVRSLALLPDGTVFVETSDPLVGGPFGYVWDPLRDTQTVVGGDWNMLMGPPVLLADGRLFCPANAGGTHLYGPAGGVMQAGFAPPSVPEQGAVTNSVLALLADGRVLCVPTSDGLGGLYDPAADVWTLLEGLCLLDGAGNPSGYSGVVALPDGRVLCLPRGATPALIVSTGLAGGFDADVLLSGYFNRAVGIW